MRTANRFSKGSGCYKCASCGRTTRSTGRGDNEFVRCCADCYDLAGYENAIADNGIESLSPAEVAEIKRLFDRVKELGGKPSFGYPELVKG